MKKIFLTTMATMFAAAAFAATANIDTTKQFQTIDSFTASDAWSGNFIGKFFDADKKEQLSKWLFSQKFGEDGSPEGIGLSLWRVNLGGGTWEQDGADIVPIQRRAESFLTKDGTKYDWSKAAGQQYFMKKAKEYGCNAFLFFSNTPPVQMTLNGKGYKDTDDFLVNLRPDKFTAFAEYLAECAKHFTDEGYNIRYISPFNEPGWKWTTNAQEGTSWGNPDIKKVSVELDREILKRGLNTKIFICEAERFEFLYDADSYIKSPERKSSKQRDADKPCDQIRAFFSPDSKDYIGNLKTLSRKIGAHDYHTEKTNEQIVEVREKLAECVKKYNVEFLESEWCVLPYIGDIFKKRYGKLGEMDKALHMAKLIHTDLTTVNSCGWGYWKAFEINGAHALTGVFPKNGDICQGGEIMARKKLWALGNYSFFIRPDYKRVALEGVNDLDKVFASAYISPDGKKLVVVAVNAAKQADEIKIALPDAQSAQFKKISQFRTSSSCDLAKIDEREFANAQTIKLPARSITTFVLEADK